MEIQVATEGNAQLVSISGVIDERSDFGPLAGLSGKLRIDLRGVRRLSSFGCREWIDSMRALSARARMTFIACSPAIIDQLNTTHGFLAHGNVESFIGPMLCEGCENSFQHLFMVRECVEIDGLPPVRCPSCGRTAELDDSVDKFLLFLREPTQIR
jgi:eukaryotic-like serine/threonine-protein kinase